MEKNEEDLYNIEKYKDEDLYDMLDMNNPSDRELEAKIVIMINKYSEMAFWKDTDGTAASVIAPKAVDITSVKH